jgi:hypothetical protein
MNKQRKQELFDVTSILSEALDRLSEIREEEQEAFDNMPEGLQCSARGDMMQDAMDMMDEWHGEIEEIASKIDDYAGK